MSTLIFLAACVALVYTGFCRMVRTDTGTVLCIRAVIWLLTVAALVSVAAVLVWGHTASWPDALLAWAMAAVQVATSMLWRTGVPGSFTHGPGAAAQLAEIPNVPYALLARIDGDDGRGSAMIIIPEGAQSAALWVSETHTGRRLTAGIQLGQAQWRAVESAAGQAAGALTAQAPGA